MRALGYPGRELLTKWIDELHPEVRYRMVGRAPNIGHPDAIKSAAVIELSTRKTSAQEIAQKLAVYRPPLYSWKNQLLGREVPASMKRQNNSPPVPDAAELQRQVESLQQGIHRLQLEHDILKKANELHVPKRADLVSRLRRSRCSSDRNTQLARGPLFLYGVECGNSLASVGLGGTAALRAWTFECLVMNSAGIRDVEFE